VLARPNETWRKRGLTMNEIDKALKDIQDLQSEKLAGGKQRRKKQLDLFAEDEQNVIRELLEIKEVGQDNDK